MKFLDKLVERASRGVARRSSRRGFITALGTAIVGASSIPLLPVARAAGGGASGADDRGVAPQTTGNPMDPGDPSTCEYWRYCAIDGFLCSCCGGTQNACPPGTEMSPLTWIGTCRNPADNRDYVISYNDCCGKTSCARCLCNRNVGDTPMYRPQSNNDIDWCLGTASTVYNCSTAVILGVAVEDS